MFLKIVSSILLTFVLAVGEVKSLPTTYIVDESSDDGSMYYLHKDFLGSITAITNEQGRGVEKRSYDAWGRLRNLYDWSSEEVPPMTILDRGYTGHQHLPEFSEVGHLLFFKNGTSVITPFKRPLVSLPNEHGMKIEQPEIRVVL